MEASFIIPLYNCRAHSRECLRTLQDTLPPGLAHEILLVDDGSTDGTRTWLATLPSPVRVLLNERNLGFAGTCNRGAAAARGRLLFFLNNDLVLLPGWFEPMRELLAHPATGLVGNVQLDAATGAVDHAGVTFNHQGKPGHLRRVPWLARLAGSHEVPALTGACCAVRADTWRRLGGFDDGFVNGGEDVDLCLRARAAGLRQRVSVRSVVRHHVSASPGRKRRDEENSRRLALRWRDDLARLASRACAAACLAASWDEPRDYPDPALARECFLHLLRLRDRPGARLLGAAHAALEVECARWSALLDGETDPRAPVAVTQYQPAPRVPAPVL